MRRAIVAVAVVGLCASLALAGGVQKEQISAKAKWVAHLDVESLLSGDVGKLITDQIKEKGLDKKLAEFTSVFGVDPTKDIASVTAYGEDFDPASGIIIAQGKYDQEKLLGLLKNAKNFKEVAAGDRTLYTWTDDKRNDPNDDGSRCGVFYSEKIIVVGRTDATVKAAMDVLDGKSAGSPSILPAPTKGSIFIAAADGIDTIKNLPPQSAMAKKITSGSLEIGQLDGSIFVNVSAIAKTAEDAEQARDMIKGLVALVGFAKEDAAAAAPATMNIAALLKGLKVGGEGNTVAVNFTATLKDIVDTVKLMQEQEKLKVQAAKDAAKVTAPSGVGVEVKIEKAN